MYGRKITLYDVLEVPRHASAAEIGRAYRRINAEMQQETVPPDPRRATLVREAYEVLSDPQKRDAYDEALRGPRFLGIRGGSEPGRRWGLALGIVVGALGALYLLLHREPPPAPVPLAKTLQELHTAASLAVGRLQLIDLAGQSRPSGVAVAIEEGVMMVPCSAITPGAHIVVRIPPRTIPGQIRKADDASGLCQLTMHSGGSWPLPLTAMDPVPKERVYVARLNANGDLSLVENQVKKVSPGPRGKVVELARPVGDLAEGAPLINLHGRVVAVAMDGQPTMLPVAWVEEPRPAAAAPREAEPDDAGPAPAKERKGPEVSPERRERLEKAFRPPPTVPDDL